MIAEHDREALLAQVPDVELLRAEKARRRLHDYVRWAWSKVDPAAFIDNWHIGAMCEHLEAVTRGQIQKLLITEPPRHQKSLTTCVFWPTWEWIDQPEEQFIFTSYRQDLAIRDAVKSRRLIQHDAYQAAWGDRYQLAGDVNLKHRYENNRQGHRISVGFGSALGENATRVVADDPHNMEEAHSKAIREGDVETWNSTLSMRRNNPKRDALVIIMQRLHEGDLAGAVLRQGGWVHLKIPAEYAGRRVISIGPGNLGTEDPRKQKGELICPERIGPVEIAEMKTTLGSYGTSAQLQQDPSPEEGGIIKKAWFRLWPAGVPLPPIEHLLLVYDTAYTEDTLNDPTACNCWGIIREPKHKRRVAILFDSWSEHLAWPALRRRLAEDWKARYGGNPKDPADPGKRPDALVIESKATGVSLIQDLNTEGIPAIAARRIYGTRYELDKVARASNISPLIEAGLVWLLESEARPGEPRSWAASTRDQLCSLPKGERDDEADAAVHGLTYLKLEGWLEAPLATAPRMPEKQADALAAYATQKRQQEPRNPYSV